MLRLPTLLPLTHTATHFLISIHSLPIWFLFHSEGRRNLCVPQRAKQGCPVSTGDLTASLPTCLLDSSRPDVLGSQNTPTPWSLQGTETPAIFHPPPTPTREVATWGWEDPWAVSQENWALFLTAFPTPCDSSSITYLLWSNILPDIKGRLCPRPGGFKPYPPPSCPQSVGSFCVSDILRTTQNA